MSQRALADRLGVSSTTICLLEAGKIKKTGRYQVALGEIFDQPLEIKKRRLGLPQGATNGERIRAARKVAGMSQSALGELLGISVSMVSSMETGRSGSHHQHAALAQVFGDIGLSDPLMVAPNNLEVTRYDGSEPEVVRSLRARIEALEKYAAGLRVKLAEATAPKPRRATKPKPRENKTLKIMAAHGYTQRECAKRLGINESSMSRYFHHKEPWPEAVREQMVIWFGVGFFSQDEPNPTPNEQSNDADNHDGD